ncbi:MAG: phosphatase PAP2 family protein, partial [Desulfobulbaceae bacterium]|nr:phosphatase PAP2 family protein [Desulfobulbaceae bacterium]
YAQFWEEGTGKHNGAFPSGHAAVAFSLMLPYFFLRQQQPHASKCFLFLGLSWGLLIGVMRVSQGGHFFSDVIWSGAIIYLLGVSLAALFRFDQSPTRSTIPVFLKPPPFPHLGQSAITATLVKPGYEVATAQNSYLSSRQQALPHVNSFSDQG